MADPNLVRMHWAKSPKNSTVVHKSMVAYHEAKGLVVSDPVEAEEAVPEPDESADPPAATEDSGAGASTPTTRFRKEK
jgi:hypothetical protein